VKKTASYWCKSINELKQDFPQHIVIASIMCGYNKEDWEELTKQATECGSDALELNLSCPHGMGEKGMGLACGQDPVLVEDILSWVTKVTHLPVFAKLTPNVTDILSIAQAARRGGASGVTAINTISGLMHILPDSTPWPKVGSSSLTTYGGVSGNATRPVALRKITTVARHEKDFPIMGAGGVDSADAALQFLYAGCHVVQVCSAIQNQDFTVVQDYITGLKALLYLQARDDLHGWMGQTPPAEYDERSKIGTNLPKFGPYAAKRAELRKQYAMNLDLTEYTPTEEKNYTELPENIPTLDDVRGKVLGKVTEYMKLDQKAQAVAMVDEELCINCGKCYMVCNDSGYQAIKFHEDTHLPEITDACTGCTLCVSVCPIPDCLTMVPKTIPHNISRGIPEGVSIVFHSQ
jgi:dihydropyrimidine dehydrogenase (NADP+)